jgi:hypothetical protein
VLTPFFSEPNAACCLHVICKLQLHDPGTMMGRPSCLHSRKTAESCGGRQAMQRALACRGVRIVEVRLIEGFTLTSKRGATAIRSGCPAADGPTGHGGMGIAGNTAPGADARVDLLGADAASRGACAALEAQPQPQKPRGGQPSGALSCEPSTLVRRARCLQRCSAAAKDSSASWERRLSATAAHDSMAWQHINEGFGMGRPTSLCVYVAPSVAAVAVWVWQALEMRAARWLQGGVVSGDGRTSRRSFEADMAAALEVGRRADRATENLTSGCWRRAVKWLRRSVLRSMLWCRGSGSWAHSRSRMLQCCAASLRCFPWLMTRVGWHCTSAGIQATGGLRRNAS